MALYILIKLHTLLLVLEKVSLEVFLLKLLRNISVRINTTQNCRN
jgi:hypothetical protein